MTVTGESCECGPAVDLGVSSQRPHAVPANGRDVDGEDATRILVVEDEAIIAWVLEATLKDLGFVVCGVAASESDAVSLAEKHEPDLILMDIQLGRGGSGLGAAATIRSRHDTPIIFCTAYAHDPSISSKAAALGRTATLGKPLDARQLREQIERMLG